MWLRARFGGRANRTRLRAAAGRMTAADAPDGMIDATSGVMTGSAATASSATAVQLMRPLRMQALPPRNRLRFQKSKKQATARPTDRALGAGADAGIAADAA